ncbi:MAG: ABC transporter substrate-binding protein [Thermomicrobiales bacterium]
MKRPSSNGHALPARAVSRRAFNATALSALVLGTAGRDPGAAFAQAATPEASASPVGGETRTIDTIHGPVTIPADPQRIVPVNFPSAVTLLELGLRPVGVPSYLPALAPGIESADGIPVIQPESGEFDLELIASLKPDLIVGSDWKDPEQQLAPYEEFSRIAPTVLFEWTQAAGNRPVEAAGCADAVGKSAEFETLRTSYLDLAATVKTTYASPIEAYTWDLITGGEDAWYLYGPSSSHGQVLAEAGIHFGASATQTEGYVEYSPERFDILKETGVLMIRTDEEDVTKAQPAFASLPAVTAGRLFTSAYFFPSSYGLSSALLKDVETGLKRLS